MLIETRRLERIRRAPGEIHQTGNDHRPGHICGQSSNDVLGRNMFPAHWWIRWSSALVVTAVAADPAFAQTGQTTPIAEPGVREGASGQVAAAAPERSTGLDDIVVTAQRREQRLQDVPVAVSTITDAALQRSGIENITDLKIAVPAFNATNSNGSLAPRLRGIGGGTVGPGIENSVALYVDGVYYAAGAASFLSLNSIERLEVLKGPQGTLFGRNSTAGLVQIITRTPTHAPHADISLSYGNYRRIETSAYLSGGITDTIAANLSIQYIHQGDGWGRNLGTGNSTYAVDHDLSVRSKLLFEPTDRTKLTLSGDYVDSDNSLNSALLLPGTLANAGEAPARYPGRYDSRTNHDSFVRGWQGGVSGKLEQKLGDLSFVSITAYRKSRYTRSFDFDLTTNPQPNPRPTIPYRYFVQPQPDDQFSQEVQLLSPGRGRFTWVIGGYYFNAHSGYDPLQIFFEAPFAPVAPQGQLVTTNVTLGTKSIAGFAQGTLALDARTNLTLGARYTHETRNLFATQQRVLIPSNTPAPMAPVPAQPNLSIGKPSLRASIDHHFDASTMAYASFSRGFKSGGFTAGTPAAPGYRPEELDAYEVGIKAELFDHRLRLNAAVFYYDYTNIQILTIGATGSAIANGPSARIHGLDLDFEGRLTDRLRVTGGLQLLDDRFGTYGNASISTPLGGVDQVVGSATGNRLPLVSRASFSIAPQYTLPLAAGGKIDLTGTFYHNSGWYAETDNVIRQPAFQEYGASLRWTPSGGALSVTAFGKNLGNAQSFAAQTTIPGGRHFTIWNAPRTYGLTLAAKF